MEEEQIFYIQADIFVVILAIYILTSHLIEIRNVPYFHQSVIAIIMGLLTGIFSKYAIGQELQFSSQFFFTFLLPAIIFSAGYSLRKSFFFQNFNIIGYLGIVATLIGFILISTCLFCINLIFNLMTVKQVLMLSAIFCATDTIAANSLIKPDKYPILHSVLFSEGIINDAIGIILFRTVLDLTFGTDGSFTFTTLLEMIFNFCYLLLFSLILGVISGFSLSYLFKINESFLKAPIKQASLILLNGYFTYLLGQILGLSGIIALFTCAIIMGHYAFLNISQESQRGTGLAFQTVAYISQAFIYAYLGASIISLNGQWQAFVMAFMLFAFMPLIRAVMVYLLPGVYKLMNRQFPLNSKQLKICWFSGMVRGAIAFALCLQIESDNKETIKIIAMTIALITTIIGSSTLKPFADYIGIGSDNEERDENSVYNKMVDENINRSQLASNYHKDGLGFESEVPKEGSDNEDTYNRTKKLEQLQSKYIRPIFQRKTQTIQLSDTNSKNQ